MRIDPTMPRSDVSDVLAQMRALRNAAQAGSAGEPVVNSALRNPLEVGASGNIGTTQSFGAHLESALRSVNRLQAESGRLSDGLASGQHQDLVATMVASQKANVAFQAALQVRNRLVSAYESVMNMPI